MRKLLEYADDGDTVVVWRNDRLGRSLIDVLNTVNLLRERGVKVRSISDGIDPETSSGRMMLGMLATLAEYERELITERVNAGIAAAKQAGTRFGRSPVNAEVVEQKLAIVRENRRFPGCRSASVPAERHPNQPATWSRHPAWARCSSVLHGQDSS